LFNIVGQREENAQDKKGKADDGDREEVSRPVLPEVVLGISQEVPYLLEDGRTSLPIIFPLNRNRILSPK
jgi:hypothetical protein